MNTNGAEAGRGGGGDEGRAGDSVGVWWEVTSMRVVCAHLGRADGLTVGVYGRADAGAEA